MTLSDPADLWDIWFILAQIPIQKLIASRKKSPKLFLNDFTIAPGSFLWRTPRSLSVWKLPKGLQFGLQKVFGRSRLMRAGEFHRHTATRTVMCENPIIWPSQARITNLSVSALIVNLVISGWAMTPAFFTLTSPNDLETKTKRHRRVWAWTTAEVDRKGTRWKTLMQEKWKSSDTHKKAR